MKRSFILNKPDAGSRILVVAPPRGGFTLLLSMLNILARCRPRRADGVRDAVNRATPLAGRFVERAMSRVIVEHMDEDLVFYSGEFRLLAGGPKWIDPEDCETACVRKYFGAKDLGDFTFIQYHPRFILDFDDVIHSHVYPRAWLDHPGYQDCIKFTAIRHPIDILHSSVYSINALTSEYIQRHVDDDPSDIRQELAIYKLSDPNFVEGLVTYLLKYLKEFVEVKDRFDHLVKWEDIIGEPVKTIRAVAVAAGVEVSDDFAGQMWQKLDHRNLMRWHKHNYRIGVLDDWKRSMTNTHLEIFRKHGFDDILAALGYPKIELFNPRKYTPVQKKIEECVERGEAYTPKVDDNVFWFAFNKSNFVSDKFNFKTYDRLGDARIERSCFKDEPFVEAFRERMGSAVRTANEFLAAVREAASAAAPGEAMDTVETQYRDVFAAQLPAEELSTFTDEMASIHRAQPPDRIPMHMAEYKSNNIVSVNDDYYGVPKSLGPIDLQQSVDDRPEILRGQSIEDVRAMIDS